MQLLNKSLLTNAVFSASCGLACLFASAPIAVFLGENIDASYLFYLGLMLLAFSAQIVISLRLQAPALFIKLIIFSDITWVVISSLLLLFFTEHFSNMGIFLIIDIAIIVALLAFFQAKGLQQF